MTPFEYLHPAEQIVAIMNRIYENGMTTTSGGNLSVLDPDGDMWISPSGIDKGKLRPSDSDTGWLSRLARCSYIR